MCDLTKPLTLETRGERDFFLQLVYVGLLHFCNFSALNYFVKSIIASACAIIVLFLYSPLTCNMSNPLPYYNSKNCSQILKVLSKNTTDMGTTDSILSSNDTSFNCTDTTISGEGIISILFGETVLSILMLLGLVWMLNREFEKAYRVTFHCSRLSTKDRRQILNLKNQADWLLHNIIPKHVHESLKRYKKNEFIHDYVTKGLKFDNCYI